MKQSGVGVADLWTLCDSFLIVQGILGFRQEGESCSPSTPIWKTVLLNYENMHTVGPHL